jgi:hypothetical protein
LRSRKSKLKDCNRVARSVALGPHTCSRDTHAHEKKLQKRTVDSKESEKRKSFSAKTLYGCTVDSTESDLLNKQRCTAVLSFNRERTAPGSV